MTVTAPRAPAAFALAFLALAAPAQAGDAAAGETTFARCKSCHMIVSPGGDVVVKGGRTGPNLWGIMGRTAGTVDGFRYGPSLVAAGDAGLVWDEASLAEYVTDPRAYLRARLDDPKAKSRMAFKLRRGGADVAAFLARHGAGS